MLITLLLSNNLFATTKISIIPPAGFEKATGFTGFQQIETFSTIKIQEYNQSITSLQKDMASANLLSKSTVTLSSEAIEISGQQGWLLSIKEKISNHKFHKWILLFGDQFSAVSVTASTPESGQTQLIASLKEALVNVIWERDAYTQLFKGLPFKFSQSKDLKFTRRTAKMVILTEKTTGSKAIKLIPSLVIGSDINREEIIDIVAFSKNKLEQLKDYSNFEIQLETETKIDGIRAYKILATAMHKPTEKPVNFYQILVFQQHKYLIIQGVTDPETSKIFLEQFDTISNSLVFKNPAS